MFAPKTSKNVLLYPKQCYFSFQVPLEEAKDDEKQFKNEIVIEFEFEKDDWSCIRNKKKNSK